jgi:hypothetical protein
VNGTTSFTGWSGQAKAVRKAKGAAITTAVKASI